MDDRMKDLADRVEKEIDLAWWCQECRECGMIHCCDVWYGPCGMKKIPREEAAQRYAALRSRKESPNDD